MKTEYLKMPNSFLNVILDAKAKLQENGIAPKWVKLSPLVHEWLLTELNNRDGTRHRMLLEVCGLTVKVEPECPAGGAYIEGEEEDATTRQCGNQIEKCPL